MRMLTSLSRLSCALCCLGWLLSTSPSHAKQPTSQPTQKTANQKSPKKTPKEIEKQAQKKAKKKAQKKRLKSKRALDRWLVLGPAQVMLPAFHKEKIGRYTYKKLLTQSLLPITSLHPTQPKAGDQQDWFTGKKLVWKKGRPGITPAKGTANVHYAATFLEVDRYTELKLHIRSHQHLRVFHNNRVIATKAHCTRPKRHRTKKTKSKKKQKKQKKQKAQTKRHKGTEAKRTEAKSAGQQALLLKMMDLLSQQTKAIKEQAKTIAAQAKKLAKRKRRPLRNKHRRGPSPGLLRATLRLKPGVHRLIVKSMATPGCISQSGFQALLRGSKKSAVPSSLKVTTKPYHRHSLGFYFHRTRTAGMALSPDGKTFAIRLYRTLPNFRWEMWLELRRTKDGKLLHSSRPSYRLRSLQWSPDGKWMSFLSSAGRGKGLIIWLVDTKSGKVRKLRAGIKKMRFHMWAPNSRFLVVGATQRQRPSKNERAGAKRLRGMNDRYPWYRTRTHLLAVNVQSGAKMRLTAGEWGVGSVSIHPKSSHILFSSARPDYTARPYSRAEVYELDLATLKTTKLFDNLRWLSRVSYSPDGKKLLLTGGPSLFGHLGRGPGLQAGQIPNDYEGDAFIYNRTTRKYKAISRTFKPHIQSVYWHPKDGNIYITALDGTRSRLYKYDTKASTYTTLPTGVDMTYSVRFADDNDTIIYAGQGIAHPTRIYTMRLSQPKPRQIMAPNTEWFRQLQLASVHDFVTKSKKGVRLEGRVYLPPDFDPRKKYPAIVYYYGGTFPTPRYFDGAYSGQFWAAHGYVTYILQPSGAVGYGQKFAARHVNEWGSIVAKEIIDATKDFLKAHPFVDPKRVGCAGASYGGFMTMSIVTKTSLFAAAISHAGISNITSYWGAGFWGFWYSAIATAARFPWSHRSLYVGQSPLFSAHKVTTPLLLIHGSKDNNVPPAESYQMYTALRLLKKQVELVLFKGEGHGVANRKKRKLWMQTMLAWFSKHLKKRPLWWKELYGTRKH